MLCGCNLGLLNVVIYFRPEVIMPRSLDWLWILNLFKVPRDGDRTGEKLSTPPLGGLEIGEFYRVDISYIPVSPAKFGERIPLVGLRINLLPVDNNPPCVAALSFSLERSLKRSLNLTSSGISTVLCLAASISSSIPKLFFIIS